MRLLAPLGLAAVLLTACGPTTHPPTTRPATARPSPSPSPTPLPDVHTIDITSTGVGAFDLVAVPVAVLHSNATRDLATGVVVHFTTSLRGRTQFSLDSAAVEVFPGQSLIVTANCTDTCEGADGVTATVTVTAWTTTTATPIMVAPATYHCGGACHGRGYGDAIATVHGAGVAASSRVDLFAECQAADGTIVGGGQRAVIWPTTGADEQFDVPVILSAQPATCTVTASPASSTATASPSAAAGTAAGSTPAGSAAPRPTVPAG